jgi:hypothetical protein
MEGGEFEKDYWATERVCDRRRKAMEQSGEGAEKDGAENVYTPYRYGANVLQGKGADKFVTPQKAENGSCRRWSDEG